MKTRPKRRFRLSLYLVPLLLSALWMGFSMHSKSIELREGARAPGFTLADAGGRIRRLEDYHGGWLVLYFYPKDDTPGCTQEACRFRDDYQAIRELGVTVV